MDPFTAIMIAEEQWELVGVEPSPEKAVEAWQYLHDTGLAYQLQGWFGRGARDLIARGIITDFDPDDYTVRELRDMREAATGQRARDIETALALRDGGALAGPEGRFGCS